MSLLRNVGSVRPADSGYFAGYIDCKSDWWLTLALSCRFLPLCLLATTSWAGDGTVRSPLRSGHPALTLSSCELCFVFTAHNIPSKKSTFPYLRDIIRNKENKLTSAQTTDNEHYHQPLPSPPLLNKSKEIHHLLTPSCCHCQVVSGHGAVVFPPPRNNIDHQESPWSDGVPQPVPAVSDPRNGFWCPVPDPFFNGTLTGGTKGTPLYQ